MNMVRVNANDCYLKQTGANMLVDFCMIVELNKC